MLKKLLNRLRKQDIRIHLFLNVQHKNILKEAFEQNKNIKIHEYQITGPINFISKYPSVLYKLLQLKINCKTSALWLPNIIHSIAFMPASTIFTYISNHWLTRTGPLYSLLYTIEFFVSDLMIYEYDAQIRQIFSSSIFASSNKNTVIPTGHNYDKYPEVSKQSKNNKKIKIGTLSEISGRKGIHDVIAATAGIIDGQKQENVTLTVAGESANEKGRIYKERIKEDVENLGIYDNVKFRGWVKDVISFLEQIDIYVLASYEEGLSGSIREAAAMGIPIVATKAGGNVEIVRDSYNGLLVPIGNVDKIERALLEIMDNYSGYKARAINHSDYIRSKYSRQRFVKSYCNTITSNL